MSRQPLNLKQQRGAVLVVGMILLGVIMLMVAGGFMMGSTNLKAVSNQQFRNEAIAASSVAIEQVTGTPFTDSPKSEEVLVDLNKDDTTDYTVAIGKPECVEATVAETTAPSSESLHPGIATAQTWNTVWDIGATVVDETSGANVTVHSGVRVLLSKTEKEAVCP